MAPATLRLVRFAMLTMMLLFVGIAWFVHRNAPEMPAESASNLPTLRWVGFGLCVAAIVAIAVLRGCGSGRRWRRAARTG